MLAARQGIRMKEDSGETALNKAKLFASSKTSFQRDFETPGKQNELDLFGGTILRMGKEFGISVPKTESVYKDLSLRNSGKK